MFREYRDAGGGSCVEIVDYLSRSVLSEGEGQDEAEIGKQGFHVFGQFLENWENSDAKLPTLKKDLPNREIERVGPESYQALELVDDEQVFGRGRNRLLLSEKVGGVN